MASTVADGANRVRQAIAAVTAGRPIAVVDDADRENEGDLIFAAECAISVLLAFTNRHTSGYVCGLPSHGIHTDEPSAPRAVAG